MRDPISKNKTELSRKRYTILTFDLHTCIHRYTHVHIHIPYKYRKKERREGREGREGQGGGKKERKGPFKVNNQNII